MKKEHHYQATITWTGAESGSTADYKSYSRRHSAEVPGKKPLELSADPAFLGDPSTMNPEDCLVVALSSCHMLSYLALAAMKGVEVIGYSDRPSGTMLQENLGGRFSEVTLRPEVTIAAGSDKDLAIELHETAGEVCFIAASVNFPVTHEPIIRVKDD